MLKFAHGRVLSILTPLWLLWVVWLFPRLSYAGSLDYDQGIRDLNWSAIGLAALTGFAGGFGMLILALATDKRVVRAVMREGLRNALASPIMGLLAYGVLQAVSSFGWRIPFEVSFVAVLVAGMAAVSLWAFITSTASAGAPAARNGLIDLMLSFLTRWKAAPPKQEPPQ